MLIHKKKLWFLAAVPLYVLCCYLSVLFFDKEFHINDILCLSVFVMSATAIMVCKKKALTILCCFLFHLTLIGTYFFLSDTIALTFNDLFVYALFCFPPLVVIYLVLNEIDLQNKQNETKAAKKNSDKQFLFEVLCFAPFMIILMYLIIKREFFYFKFDATAFCLLLISVFQILLLIGVYLKKGFMHSDSKKPLSLTLAISVCDCFAYSFFAYRFVQDKVYLAFPMITALILIYEAYTAVKS